MNSLYAALAVPQPLGVFRVWQRNRDTFFRLWRTELWPPFVEALMNLFAFGFGIGGYVTQQVEGLDYLLFVAPGLVMTSAMFGAFFECSFGSFVRMEFQHTFDAIIATPVNIEDVIMGEIVWGATRATMTSTGVLLVLAVLGLTPSPWVVLVPVVGLLTGLMFGALAECASLVVPSINEFTWFLTLGLTPMWLFSGVFFPLERIPEAVRWISWLSPLQHAVAAARALSVGRVTPDLLGHLAWMVVVVVLASTLALYLGRRRLIK